MRHIIVVLLAMLLAGGFCVAQQDLADFWQQGRVRELFSSGLANEDEQMAEWAAEGVNCLTGAKPELAHKHGLKTRSWFTMNYMDSRWMDEEKIKSLAARNRDGSYRRPFDPLFPTIGQYGWSACVNNPGWVEHSQQVFRNQATDDYDGAHIDYAGHYEACFCDHCKAKWDQWAPAHELADASLDQATDAGDLRTRMLLREFRIQCVMEFLGGLREAARSVKPGFAIDGTWHQDNGSAYQWAYGDHFDLMCIEGTTRGPFPPESNQVLWLKLAHALSRREDRRPVAMSVTYHLLRDEESRMFHGRMAADRVRVALAEIFSQGGVSWLGLGGPKTGNLLREHQDLTKAYFRVARDLEPLLVDSEDVAEIGVVFSARSFLYQGKQRDELYAIGQTLMKSHVPFRIISDVGLTAAQLEGLSGVLLLSAPVLSDAACGAVQEYVSAGGKALVMGADCATLNEVWQERGGRPEFATPPEGGQGILSKAVGTGTCWYWAEDPFEGMALGAAQYVTLGQDEPTKMAIEGWSKAEGVSGAPDVSYSLYVDLHHTDGSPLWGQVALFDTGTHDWQFSRTIIESDRPFKGANVHLLFRNHRGAVWFKDVKFGVWNEDEKRIEKNLLAENYRLADGKTYSAAPGENAQQGAWGPYRDGYELENMLDMGLWVKMTSNKSLTADAMTQTDPVLKQVVLDAVAPLRAKAPPVTITGEGAGHVYADLKRTGNNLLVQLINYSAQLHPDLPELEQQEADKSIPATDLTVTLALDGAAIKPGMPRVILAEGDLSPAVSCADGTARIDIPRLDQYVALVFQLED